MTFTTNIFWTCLIAILMVACTENRQEEIDHKNAHTNLPSVMQVETLFAEEKFSNPMHLELLKELDVCVMDSISSCAQCSPKNFKIYPWKGQRNIEDAFMLQIKALTVLKGQEVPLPVRHLILFEREGDELVKVNGFRGNLAQIIDRGKDHVDLVIRFYLSEDDIFVNCLFEWNGGQYSFKSVEGIDWGEGTKGVKEEHKEEISKEIYHELMTNALIF